MTGGTGRRRKPPVGEEGNEQYTPPQPPAEPYPQYQTYAPPAEPQYDYDWRQQAPGAYEPTPTYQPQTPPQPPAQPQAPPSQPRYDAFQAYQPQPQPQQPSVADLLGSGGYQIPQQAAPATRPRPAPRPDPQTAPAAAPAAPSPAAPAPFEFEFDLDDDEPAAAAPSPEPVAETSAEASAPTSTRPADKDGYRADDFAFVDKADEPDVKGWLSFSESRADSRAERTRRMRFRLIALGTVLVLVGAGVGVYMWLGGSVPGLTAQAATKSMILFRLDDADGDSVGDALMVTQLGGSTNGTASGTGAIVVIPAQMQIDDQGFGSQPFGGNMASEEPPAGSDVVADTLGVTPDGVWTMTETVLGIFVDDLGGISLTTNTAIPASTADPKGVTQGTVTLDGDQAVAYATYTASGEAATAQAARFGQVLNALMAAMPTQSNAVNAYLRNLALIPDPSLPMSKLGPILAALAAQQNAGKVTVATLPLTSSNALNSTGAAEIVAKLLGGTVKAGASAGQAARVLVQNGTGASTSSSGKLMAAAQAKLVDAGYTYNAGDVVAAQATTKVEVASSADQSIAQQVAASMGLGGSSVEVVPGLSSVDDVTVVLGKDWTSLSLD